VLTRELLGFGAARVIAIDGSPGMLAYAQKTVQSVPGVELEWVRGRVESLPSIHSGAIDGVLCSSVIEYVDNPEALLLEITRILKPGGRLVLSVPPKGSVVRSLQKMARGIYLLFGRDAFAYLSVSRFEVNRASLPSLFERHGLSISQVTAFDPILPRSVSTVLQPSLLIVEGRKLAA
jgi:2-polyprenyl-6-hydroxyphenyl methylase/3-demethylubiquinone-9 3-methyltransferase